MGIVVQSLVRRCSHPEPDTLESPSLGGLDSSRLMDAIAEMICPCGEVGAEPVCYSIERNRR